MKTSRAYLTLMALLLLLPSAAATSGVLEADRITFQDQFAAHGEAVAFTLHAGTGGSQVASSLAGALRAERVEVEAVTKPMVAVDAPPSTGDLLGTGPVRVPLADITGEQVRRYSLTNADLRVSDHQDRIGIHGFGAGGSVVQSRFQAQETNFEAFNGFAVTRDGMAADVESDDSEAPTTTLGITQPSNGTDFTIRQVSGAWLVSTSHQGAASLSLIGDFELEVIGVTWRGISTEGPQEVATGYFRESLVPQSSTGRVVGYDNFTMARLVVTNGVLDLTALLPSNGVRLGSGTFHWATASMSTASQGTVSLSGATGELTDGSGTRVLRGQSEVLQGSYEWEIAPLEESRLGLDLAASDAAAQNLAGWSPANARVGPASDSVMDVPMLASLGILVVVVAAALVWRLRRVDYDDVEAALEGQRFPEAARLARRLLRRDGGHEEAAISLGVALTKAGRPHEAVAAVQQHVVVHEPSDGVLHYVLGLAFLESGQEDAARAALGEALERTPALEAEMRHNPATKPFFSPRGAPSVKGTTAYV